MERYMIQDTVVQHYWEMIGVRGISNVKRSKYTFPAHFEDHV